MIFLYALILGVVLGYVRGGRLSHLASLRLRATWLVLLALVIQVLIFPLFTKEPLIQEGTAILHGVSYALLGIWLLLNLRVSALIVIGAGALMNAIAIMANGGLMPASTTALDRAGYGSVAQVLMSDGSFGNIVRMSPATRFDVLGDWLYLPRGWPLAAAFSLGDAVIMVGIVWLIARGMRRDA